MRGFGGCDRAIDICGGAVGHTAERLLGRGVDRLEPLAAFARNELAADQHHAAHEIGLVDVHVLKPLSSSAVLTQERFLPPWRPGPTSRLRSGSARRTPSANWRPDRTPVCAAAH